MCEDQLRTPQCPFGSGQLVDTGPRGTSTPRLAATSVRTHAQGPPVVLVSCVDVPPRSTPHAPLEEVKVSQIKNLGRIVIPVANLDAAIEIDTSKPGFNLASDVPLGDRERWVELALQRRRRHPVDDCREPAGGAGGASQRALGGG